MIGRKIYLFLIFSLIPFLIDAQESKFEISLEDCILRALKSNLDISVQLYNPKIAETSVLQAQSIFSPSFSLNTNWNENSRKSYTILDGASIVNSNFASASLSLQKKFEPGTSLTFTIGTNRSFSNSSFNTYNPSYNSQYRFDIRQPLLKGFGTQLNTYQIKVASNSQQITLNQLKSNLINLIYNVEQAYWNLIFTIEDLKVKQQSLKLAKDLLEKNRLQVKVGTLPPMDVLAAEAEVAMREGDVIVAESALKNAEDTLKRYLNFDNEEWAKTLVPTSKPEYGKREFNIDELLNLAISNRPELRQAELDLKSKELGLNYAKNQLLPTVDLVGTFYSTGVSGDIPIYNSSDPFNRQIIGRIKGSTAESLNEAFKNKYKNYAVGFTISYPLFNSTERANYAKAQLEAEQASLQLKSITQQIIVEVRSALRDAESASKRVEATKIARELAEKKLQAEEKKLAVGLSTNYQVLQFQRDLATAQTTELRAIIDYKIALSKLDRVLGKTLESHNINFEEVIQK
ncbi:MAG: TolC family protein [Candidatus Aminicenantia bacterium]